MGYWSLMLLFNAQCMTVDLVKCNFLCSEPRLRSVHLELTASLPEEPTKNSTREFPTSKFTEEICVIPMLQYWVE